MVVVFNAAQQVDEEEEEVREDIIMMEKSIEVLEIELPTI